MSSGEQRSVIVKKVGINTVEYVRYDDQSGATYEVSVEDVRKIKYQNGSEDSFQQIFNDQSVSKVAIKTKGEFTDARDSATYQYVIYGSQTWMAENLRYRMGKSLCHYSDEGDCDECGRYYTFNEALVACPGGWHLPTDEEWIELEIEAGMWEAEAYKIGWRGTSPGQAPAFMKNGSTGLDIKMCGSLIPGRLSHENPKYERVNANYEGYYWTGTEVDERFAYFRHFKDRASIEKSSDSKKYRLPVRCVKD